MAYELLIAQPSKFDVYAPAALIDTELSKIETYPGIWSAKHANTSSLVIRPYATHNCQMSVVSHGYMLLYIPVSNHPSPGWRNTLVTPAQLRERLEAIRRGTPSHGEIKILLIDVRDDYAPYFLDLLPKVCATIIMRHLTYVSTNGHSMSIFMLNLTTL